MRSAIAFYSLGLRVMVCSPRFQCAFFCSKTPTDCPIDIIGGHDGSSRVVRYSESLSPTASLHFNLIAADCALVTASLRKYWTPINESGGGSTTCSCERAPMDAIPGERDGIHSSTMHEIRGLPFPDNRFSDSLSGG